MVNPFPPSLPAAGTLNTFKNDNEKTANENFFRNHPPF